MTLDDLIIELEPPPNRRKKCDGETERHLTEAAVMLAYGLHLLATLPELASVELHPDGEHGKRFPIKKWLSDQGFALMKAQGTTNYCGTYVSGERRILVTAKSGQGDVVASTPTESIIAECKGGIVNKRHPGQVYRLRKGLCEAVGLLMTKAWSGRQIAVVPYTDVTSRRARIMATRAKEAGIEISLVNEHGEVIDIKP